MDTSHLGVHVWILVVAAVFGLFEITWTLRFCAFNINYDAISYIGIARHILNGEFRASVNGYWSPLFSWLVVLGGISGFDLTLIGRGISVLTYLLSVVLLYLFTLRLWGSLLTASLAVLWFVLARGLAAFAVGFIGADFLLMSLVLLYFILLLDCIKYNRPGRWVGLGLVHAAAFLAKAFALHWLGLTTFISAFWFSRSNLRRGLSHFFLACLVPGVVWLGWGLTLRGKYGVFMSGYQFRKNILQWTFYVDPDKSSKLWVLRDETSLNDSNMVRDYLPPSSAVWGHEFKIGSMWGRFLVNEKRNIPIALKELAILVTPGGLLALILGLLLLLRRHAVDNPRAKILFLIGFSSASLVATYSLLVVDGRYVFPLVPLILAAAIGFIMSPRDQTPSLSPQVQRGLMVLTGACTILFLAYHASPFRRPMADLQRSCYEAAHLLQREPRVNNELVVLGEGPYPAFGVGWEAGVYAAYFSGAKVTGSLSRLDIMRESDILHDVGLLRPGAVLLWGLPREQAYRGILDLLEAAGCRKSLPVLEQRAREVGPVMYMTYPLKALETQGRRSRITTFSSPR